MPTNNKQQTIISRRRVLSTGMALLAGGPLLNGQAVAAAQLPKKILDSSKVPGSLPSELGERSPFEPMQRLVSKRALSGISRTPLEKLTGIITPSDLHFERHHAGIPAIEPDSFELLVHGMVENPLKFTLEDLKRFPSESRICFIECSGNGSGATLGKGKVLEHITAGQLDGLISTSEWTGVRLSTLLREVGIKPKTKWLLAESQDAARLTRSIPIEKAMDDAMIVYAQNGEPLRPAQGYPLRLLLPGWEGNTQIKWLKRIELSDTPFMTYQETAKYTDAMSDGRIKMFTFSMAPKSTITSPSYPNGLNRKGWHEIKGLAWSGYGKIRSVEVSTDGGLHWHKAKLHGPILSKCTSYFRFMWNWNGKQSILMSRATDETGRTQPTPIEFSKGRGPGTTYHSNAIRPWKVDSDGQVTFALNEIL